MLTGNDIAAERKRRRITQAEFAALAKLEIQTVVAIELGKVSLTQAEYARLIGVAKNGS